MDYILNLIFPTIILAIIVVTYYNYLLPFRFKNRVLLILPVISIITVTLFMRGMSYKNMILNFAANSLSVMLALVFFKDIVRGILYALIYEVVALLHDGLIYYVMDILLGEIAITTMPYFALSRIALVLLISVSLLAIAKKLKSIQRLNVPKKYWILILILPIGSIFLTYSIYGLYQNALTMIYETLVSLFILFLMLISLIIIYGNLVDYLSVKLENHNLSTQFEAFIQKQQNLFETSRETRRIQHDLKNRLHPILSALDSEQYQSAKSSLNEILGEIDTSCHEYAYTGLEYIDDMINYKAGIAQKDGISFTVENKIAQFPDVPYLDVSAAIGIALDNAIEACRKEGISKIVNITFYCQMSILYIKIENELADSLIHNRVGGFLSTKSEPAKHGFGLSSIRLLVIKHGGDLITEVVNGRFITKLVFTLNNPV